MTLLKNNYVAGTGIVSWMNKTVEQNEEAVEVLNANGGKSADHGESGTGFQYNCENGYRQDLTLEARRR